ncbi:MAG: PKD domain-containing protein [Saprospiraceae bacterium]
MKYISILLAINILLNYQNTNAQNTNCAVNAGVSANWCFGQDIQLKGNVAGEIVPNSILWTQISGPAVIISNADQLNASIKSAPAGNYEFNLTVQCTQGKTSQNVTQVVFPEIIVNAGPDITLDCYDMSPIPLTGFAFPPVGYVSEWKINPVLGSITNNVFSPNQSVFIRMCDQQKKDTVFTLDFSYYNPQTGCKYSTKKKIYFRDYIIPMKIASNQACPEKLEDFAALVNCSGISTQSGQWSFVSPINGGGASFANPNSTFSAFNNLKPNSTYIIKWTVTTNCGGT